MKALFLYVLFILSQQVIAQSTLNGLYVNDADEFICFNNDTVCFRIHNNDAFGTFTIGQGKFVASERNKYCIFYSNQITSHTSMLVKQPREDKELIINVLNDDSIPLKFAKIIISKTQVDSSIIICYSDENGQLILNSEQIKLFSGEMVSIRVETVGFFTEKTLNLECGYNYLIQSVIQNKYPFTINKNEKIKIKNVGTNKILVKIGKSLSLILIKSSVKYSCSDVF